MVALVSEFRTLEVLIIKESEMINPMGLYAMGMASSRDPDVAGKNAVSMYQTGLQQQEQSEYRNEQNAIRREDMQRKIQEQEMQREALKKFAEAYGIDPAVAGAMSSLPPAMQSIVLQEQTGAITPEKQAEIDFKTAQTDKLRKEMETPKRSSTDEKMETKWLEGLGNPEMNARKARSAKPLVDEVGTGKIGGSSPVLWLQSLFGNEKNVDDLQGITDQIQTEYVNLNKTPGSVSNFEQQVWSKASGAKTTKGEAALKSNLEAYAIAKDLEAAKSEIWDELGGKMTFKQFTTKWGSGAFDDDPRVAEAKQKYSALYPSEAGAPPPPNAPTPNATPIPTPSATPNQKKVIKFSDLP